MFFKLYPLLLKSPPRSLYGSHRSMYAHVHKREYLPVATGRANIAPSATGENTLQIAMENFMFITQSLAPLVKFFIGMTLISP